MSLINDALKRTQETTQTNEPKNLDEFGLPPIEPYQPSNGGARWILWIMIPLLVIGINLGLWVVLKNRGGETRVAARTTKAAAAGPVTPAGDTAPAASGQKTADRQAAGVGEGTGPGTSAPGPVVSERPEFKLKSIVSHPVRPSAMIDNRIVFIGDRVEGYTVTAIRETSVTLKSGNDEVVISLP